jgi:hypothetical protein
LVLWVTAVWAIRSAPAVVTGKQFGCLFGREQ